LQPQNQYKTRIWACVSKQEIKRISLTHQQFDSNVYGFQRFSTKCNKVKTINEKFFKVVIRFNGDRGKISEVDLKRYRYGDYCVAFASNEDYHVFRINDWSDDKKYNIQSKRIENIDKIKFPTGDDLKFTVNISYKSIVCGNGNDIELAIKGAQNEKFSTISKNQTTFVATEIENEHYIMKGSKKVYIDPPPLQNDNSSTSGPSIVPPIVASKNFEPEKAHAYQESLLTCPNNFFLCSNQNETQKCVHRSLQNKIRCQSIYAFYCIDEMLFRFLPALNKLIDEEEIKQNRIKREYIVMIMQHKDETNSTTYYEVPKLDFEVSELMKRDAVLKMKTKNEPIQVNSLVKIINIEFVPRKGPAWIDRNCGKVAILLFFLILFLRHYVYEKIVRIKSGNGDDDENVHGKNNGDENDDEENNNDEIRKRDERIINDEKTEIVASEV
jgi:hypothetical protein